MKIRSKQNCNTKFAAIKHRGLKLFLPFIMFVALLPQGSTAVLAAGSATLTLDPASGSYAKEASFTVTVHETSTEQVNAVQADLTYDQTKLQFVSVDMSTSAFDLNVPNSNGNGSVKISAAKSGSSLSGDQIVGKVTFKALVGSGSTSINFANSSAIVGESPIQDVWDHNPSGGTYSLTGDAPAGGTTPDPTTPPSTNTPPTKPKPPTTPGTTTPSTSNNTGSDTASSDEPGPASQTSGYYVAIKVFDSQKKAVKGASVTIGNQTKITDDGGIASFSIIGTGKYTAVITANGKKVSQPIEVVAGKPTDVQSFNVTLPAGSQTTKKLLIIAPIVLLIILAVAGGLILLKNKKWKKSQQNPTPPASVNPASSTPPAANAEPTDDASDSVVIQPTSSTSDENLIKPTHTAPDANVTDSESDSDVGAGSTTTDPRA